MSFFENDNNVINEDVIFIMGDVETTGFNPDPDKMTEIALIKTDSNFNILDRFVSFINPEQKLSAKIIEITNITDDMVEDAPKYQQIMGNVYSWWKKDTEGKKIIFVAHNADFDVKFINHLFTSQDAEALITDSIDTVSLARELYPFWKNHKLDTVADKFGIINESHHRAENDTIVLMYMAKRLITEFTQDGLNPVNFRTKKKLHYGKN
jgi:DNA polymerase-3 subunit alpha (Gram-positive type)